MPIDLLIASQNSGKCEEIQSILPSTLVKLWTPVARGIDALPIEESASTYEGNAILKATAYAQASGMWVLADDSGLEVDALDGRPGVHSARWVEGSDADRRTALLHLLGERSNRRARFVAAIVIVDSNGNIQRISHGELTGSIAYEESGTRGFGYDPIFIPDGESVTLASLPFELKNQFSHRARALAGIVPWLRIQADERKE